MSITRITVTTERSGNITQNALLVQDPRTLRKMIEGAKLLELSYKQHSLDPGARLYSGTVCHDSTTNNIELRTLDELKSWVGQKVLNELIAKGCYESNSTSDYIALYCDGTAAEVLAKHEAKRNAPVRDISPKEIVFESPDTVQSPAAISP